MYLLLVSQVLDNQWKSHKIKIVPSMTIKCMTLNNIINNEIYNVK